jgi:hypothetical protein
MNIEDAFPQPMLSEVAKQITLQLLGNASKAGQRLLALVLWRRRVGELDFARIQRDVRAVAEEDPASARELVTTVVEESAATVGPSWGPP